MEFSYDESKTSVTSEKISQDNTRKMIRTLITSNSPIFSKELGPTKLFVLLQSSRDKTFVNFLPKQHFTLKTKKPPPLYLFLTSTQQKNIINKDQAVNEMMWYQFKGIQGIPTIRSFDDNLEQIND